MDNQRVLIITYRCTRSFFQMMRMKEIDKHKSSQFQRVLAKKTSAFGHNKQAVAKKMAAACQRHDPVLFSVVNTPDQTRKSGLSINDS